MSGSSPANPLFANPQVLAMLHSTLNEGKVFSHLAVESPKKVWWQCNDFADHAWLAPIRSVAVNNVGCWVCSNKNVLVGFNDLRTSFPELAKQWHPSLNESLHPDAVTSRYSKKVWWVCDKGHEWDMPVNDRTNRGRGCPACSGHKVVSGDNDLATLHPDVAGEWHPTKNGEVLPSMVRPGSATKYWWLSETCGHKWLMSVDKRTRKHSPQGCSVCAGKVVISSTSLAGTYPEVAKEWHPTKNGIVQATDVKAGSHKKAWWLGSCGHEWDAVIKSRSISGHGCPVCANKRLLVGSNDLATVNPTLAAQWHPTMNESLTPTDVTAGTLQKAWWQCKKGHYWSALITNRSRLGVGCPWCASTVLTSVGEQQLKDYIESLGFSTVRNRKTLAGREIDVLVPEKMIGFEYNGLHWHTDKYDKTSTYHYDKWKDCKDKGIQLIQIWEDDWANKQGLLKRMVAHKLGISTERKVFARKTKIVNVKSESARMFLEENHLQGFRNATYFGLKGPDNTLVALLGVVRKPNNRIEIARFATSANVVGGFSKLLNHAVKQYPDVTSVLSYSHNDHSMGGMYEASGFEKVHETKPGYSYYVRGKRVHRLQYTKKRFQEDPSLKYEDGLTERQLAELNGLYRIWDAGSTLWEKQI